MDDKAFYVFVTLDYGNGYRTHSEAFKAYEEDDSEVKGVFHIRGYNRVEGINVKASFFSKEWDALKECARELTKQYREDPKK